MPKKTQEMDKFLQSLLSAHTCHIVASIISIGQGFSFHSTRGCIGWPRRCSEKRSPSQPPLFYSRSPALLSLSVYLSPSLSRSLSLRLPRSLSLPLSQAPGLLCVQLYLRLCSECSVLMVETLSRCRASETAPNQRLGCVMSALCSATQVAPSPAGGASLAKLSSSLAIRTLPKRC